MKTSYEVRAMRFAKMLAKLFENCVSLSDYEKMISIYNQNHPIPLNYNYGISRIAIIRSDYVIKSTMVMKSFMVIALVNRGYMNRQ